MCRADEVLDVSPQFGYGFEFPVVPEVFDIDDLVDQLPQPRQILPWPLHMFTVNQRCFACSLCRYPIISEEHAVYDEYVGVICPVNGVNCFDYFGSFDDTTIAHWERFVRCENCGDILSFREDPPDSVLNYQNEAPVAILKIGNLVSGVNFNIFNGLPTINDHPIVDNALVSTKTIHVPTEAITWPNSIDDNEMIYCCTICYYPIVRAKDVNSQN